MDSRSALFCPCILATR
uniref:Uncharacterized protein n=1 Tax=Rhizophora mucronata TaxID=61149 RepID=A0A2P2NP43_RHIMU